MVKVCHISTVHSVFDTRIFYKECKTLAKSGYEVYLIVTHDKEEMIDGVHIIPLPERKGRFYRFLIKDWIALFKAIKVNANIYHFHDPELIPIGIILKLFRKKVIYDIHEDYRTSIRLKKWIPSCLKNFTTTLFLFFETIGIEKFDGIVFAEKYYKNIYKKKNTVSIDLLNYPIINNKIIHTEKPIKIIRKNAFKLIYTGNVNKERGIVNIMESFLVLAKHIENVDLYIVGYTPQDVFSYITDILAKNDLESRVLIVGKDGYVKRELIDLYYKYMDIGLALIPPNPHYYNKLLTKFYEYMQNGLPVVASDFPLWKKFFDKNQCGITVNPMDPIAVSDAVESLLKNTQKMRTMGENGKKLVKEIYNWNIESKKLLNLYRELLK